MNQKLGLPTSKEYLKEFIERTILPSQKKQSNTVFFVKGTGRNSLLKYISQNKETVVSELDTNLQDTLLLTVDTKDRDLIKDTWFRMLEEQGQATGKLKNLNILGILGKLTKERGKRVLLCVWVKSEGVDITFLEALRQTNSMMIDFQFAFPFEVLLPDMKNYLGNLTELALQNIWYMPLYEDEGSKAIIANQIVPGFVRVSAVQQKKILKLSGGYPSLLRFFLRNTDKIDVSSWKNPEVRHFFDGIWDALTEKTQSDLVMSVSEGKSNLESDFVRKTKLFVTKENSLISFSSLFDEYVKHLLISQPPSVTWQEDIITVSGQNINTLLSEQEVEVFRLLFGRKEEIVSRDSIAEVMWGNDWEEKYSDWAIDQLISRIRKKIGDRAQRVLIKTIRGKGFVIDL